MEQELKEACAILRINPNDFSKHIEEEKTYLEGLKKSSPEVETKGRYVEALNELRSCRYVNPGTTYHKPPSTQLADIRQEWESARASVNRTLEGVAPINALAVVAQARMHVDITYAKLQHAEGLVGTLERILNISDRWTAESPEYKRFHQENIKTKYQDAINHLERLVVMRLFELTKLSSSGTGMFPFVF